MTDIAKIAIAVDSSDLEKGTKALADLGEQSKKTVTATNNVVDANERLAKRAATAAAANAKLSNTYKEQIGFVNQLKSALVGLAALYGVGQLVTLTDQYNQLSARVKMLTAATGDFKGVMQALTQTSEKNGVSLKTTVDMFQKFQLAAKDLGASNAQMVKLTGSFQELGILSGTNEKQFSMATNTIIRMFEQGHVKGTQFNMLMRSMPAAVQTIADGYGVSVGKLKQMADAGKVTSEGIFQALMKEADVIAMKFMGLPPSLARALAGLKTSVMSFMGSVNNSTHFLDNMARGVQAIGSAFNFWKSHIGELIAGLIALAGVITVLNLQRFATTINFVSEGFVNLAIAMEAGVIPGVTALIGSFGNLTGSIKMATGATLLFLAANPEVVAGLALIAAGAAAAALAGHQFEQELKKDGATCVNFGDIAHAAFGGIADSVHNIGQAFADAMGPAATWFKKAIDWAGQLEEKILGLQGAMQNLRDKTEREKAQGLGQRLRTIMKERGFDKDKVRSIYSQEYWPNHQDMPSDWLEPEKPGYHMPKPVTLDQQQKFVDFMDGRMNWDLPGPPLPPKPPKEKAVKRTPEQNFAADLNNAKAALAQQQDLLNTLHTGGVAGYERAKALSDAGITDSSKTEKYKEAWKNQLEVLKQKKAQAELTTKQDLLLAEAEEKLNATVKNSKLIKANATPADMAMFERAQAIQEFNATADKNALMPGTKDRNKYISDQTKMYDIEQYDQLNIKINDILNKQKEQIDELTHSQDLNNTATAKANALIQARYILEHEKNSAWKTMSPEKQEAEVQGLGGQIFANDETIKDYENKRQLKEMQTQLNEAQAEYNLLVSTGGNIDSVTGKMKYDALRRQLDLDKEKNELRNTVGDPDQNDAAGIRAQKLLEVYAQQLDYKQKEKDLTESINANMQIAKTITDSINEVLDQIVFHYRDWEHHWRSFKKMMSDTLMNAGQSIFNQTIMKPINAGANGGIMWLLHQMGVNSPGATNPVTPWHAPANMPPMTPYQQELNNRLNPSATSPGGQPGNISSTNSNMNIQANSDLGVFSNNTNQITINAQNLTLTAGASSVQTSFGANSNGINSAASSAMNRMYGIITSNHQALYGSESHLSGSLVNTMPNSITALSGTSSIFSGLDSIFSGASATSGGLSAGIAAAVGMASGGILNSPTMFPGAGAGGANVVAGEAGPEAVLPLTRVNGVLGVKTSGGSNTQSPLVFNHSVTVNVQGAAGATEGQNAAMAQQISDQATAAARAMVMDELNNQQRPGGALYNAYGPRG